MKNKQHIMILFEVIEFCKPYIPSGMYRSVEKGNTALNLHPIGDASLTGCKEKGVMAFSTERCIPTEYSPIGDTVIASGAKQSRTGAVIARSVSDTTSLRAERSNYPPSEGAKSNYPPLEGAGGGKK